MRRFLALGAAWLCCASAAALELSPEEQIGRRIYHEGVGIGATPIQARVGRGDTGLAAALVPCASCHGADGRGRAEGGVRPSDISWRRLSLAYAQRSDSGREHPAYDSRSLARALGEGRDPGGNRLDPSMPRFALSPRELRALIAYLKRIEDERDPGIEVDRLRLGTLLPSRGGLAWGGHAVEAILRNRLEQINQAGGIHGRHLELVVADPGATLDSARAALRRLLEEERVFALLTPFAPALEGRYGALLQAAGAPLIGPLSPYAMGEDHPLVFEPLAGLREQMLALGRFAGQHLALGDGEALILHPPLAAQQRLAEQLAQQLTELGWRQVARHSYSGADGPPGATPQVLFFLGSAPDFRRLAEALAADGQHSYLLAASAQVASSALRLPEGFSRRLFLAYPFVPSDWTVEGIAALSELRGGLGNEYAVLQVATYSAVQLLAEGLRRAGRDLSRARLVRSLEGLHDFPTGLTPALSFGPGQRVGTAGAHIVTLDIAERRFQPVSEFIRIERP